MPDAVLNAMHRAAPNIYSGALIDMMPALMADLRRVARTKHHVAMYIGNGHAAWEAALSNVIAPGDKVLVPSTGRFGIGWGEMKQLLFEHINNEIAGMRAEYERLAANPGYVEEVLKAGAAKARAISVPFLNEIRQRVGVRPVG